MNALVNIKRSLIPLLLAATFTNPGVAEDTVFLQHVWEVDEQSIKADEGTDMGQGAIIDLSNAVIVDKVEREYRIFGDSLASRVCKGVREWFELRGDTIYLISVNDRKSIGSTVSGIPYRFRPGKSIVTEKADSVRTFYCSIISDTRAVSLKISVDEGCTFVFAPNDTVESEYCIVTEQKDGFTTATERRWYAGDCTFPVVESLDVTDADKGDRAWTRLLLCPPSEQAEYAAGLLQAHESDAMGKPGRTDRELPGISTVESDLWNKSQMDSDEYTIDFDAGRIGVSLRDNNGNGISGTGACRIYLCDSAGRICGNGTDSITTASPYLADGVYVLYIVAGDRYAATKIRIENNTVR